MRLKDMFHALTTAQPIRIIYPTGESNIARLEEFTKCEKCIVTDIYCRDGELNIEIAEPYDDLEGNIQEVMVNVLEDLIEKHPNQIAEIVSKDSGVERLENVFTYMGISTEMLDKYKY